MDLVKDLSNSCNDAFGVLDSLLDLERMESTSLVKSRLEPIRFVLDSLTDFGALCAERQIDFKLLQDVVLPDVPYLYSVAIDPIKMRHAVRTLTRNAIESTPSVKSVTISAAFTLDTSFSFNVALDPRLKVGTFKLSFHDEGFGLSPAGLENAMKELTDYKLNPYHDHVHTTTKLGLVVVRSIVAQHQGMLLIESSGEGFGTTYSIELPLFKGAEAPPIVPPGIRRCSSSSSLNRKVGPAIGRPLRRHDTLRSSGGASNNNEIAISLASHSADFDTPVPPMHILVVDDSEMNRKIIIRLLKSHGHSFEEAEDGRVCVDKIRASLSPGGKPFDIILLDNSMPNLTGPEAASEVRVLGFEGLIIGVTGNSLPEDIAEFEERGAELVLLKPINSLILVDAIKLLLKARPWGVGSLSEVWGGAPFRSKPVTPTARLNWPARYSAASDEGRSGIGLLMPAAGNA